MLLEKQAEVAAEFDAINTVERAREVGSLDAIVPPEEMRPFLIAEIERGLGRRARSREKLTKFLG